MMSNDPNDLTTSYLVDMFISDCLLPSTQNVQQAAHVYKVFEAYCESIQVGVPCGLKIFGKYMKKRFQRKLRNGKAMYFLDFRDGLFDAED